MNMVDTWWIPGGYLVDTWWIPGGYLVDTWWIWELHKILS